MRSSPRTSAIALAAVAVGAGSSEASCSARSCSKACSSISSADRLGGVGGLGGLDVVELGAVARGVGLQGRHHPGVEQALAVARHRRGALGDDGQQPARPLDELLDACQTVADVVGASRRELGAQLDHLGVEAGQLGLERGLRLRGLDARGSEARELGPQAGDLAAGDVHAQGAELGDELAVAAGGLGLALERAQLAAHLAQQVLHAQQAGLGGVEAALGLLLALAVLQHAGGLLDDRPALLGPGVEHGVDLALADDHVLLAADAGVGEQLLDVEQPARDAVDRVLAVAGAEQRAA